MRAISNLPQARTKAIVMVTIITMTKVAARVEEEALEVKMGAVKLALLVAEETIVK